MQKNITKGIQEPWWLGGKGDPLGIAQEIQISYTDK